jgi:hypothetical protein
MKKIFLTTPGFGQNETGALSELSVLDGFVILEK